MKPSSYRVKTLIFVAAALSCALPAAADASAIDTVKAYTAAFNREDADTMAGMMHPDIQWMVMGDQGLEAVSTSKEELVAQMRGYFAGPQTVTNTLSGMRETSGGVYATETASWTGPDGRKQEQTSDVYYAVTDDGLIRRVQYLEPQMQGE